MNQARSANASFIESTRSGTLVAADLKAKMQRRMEKDSMAMDSDSEKRKSEKAVDESELWVDAEDDEELMDAMLQKHGFGMFSGFLALLVLSIVFRSCKLTHHLFYNNFRETKDGFNPAVSRLLHYSLQPLPAVRPGVLVTCHEFHRIKKLQILTFDTLWQRHETYHDQYRALIVTPHVRVSKKNPTLWKDENGVCYEYWTALCRNCDAEVGTYDPLDEMYHFHDVLPSR